MGGGGGRGGSVPILARKNGTCLLLKHLLVHVQYILKLSGDGTLSGDFIRTSLDHSNIDLSQE